MSDELTPSSEEEPGKAKVPHRAVFTPPIDIYETEEGLVLYADLPGVSIETLEVQVQDNKLSLLGRVKRLPSPDAKIVHQEYPVGDFLRSFILSGEIEHEKITARMSNGVLKITLPRTERQEPRRIQVNSD